MDTTIPVRDGLFGSCKFNCFDFLFIAAEYFILGVTWAMCERADRKQPLPVSDRHL